MGGRGGRWGLTASCWYEWQPVVCMISVRFYHVGGGCGGVLSEFTETKNDCSACNAKKQERWSQEVNIALLTAMAAV